MSSQRRRLLGTIRQRHQLRAALARHQRTCWLCGQPLPISEDGQPLVAYPHPDYPTLDEIVPRSQGGSGTDPANVRLAHLRCNLRRSSNAPRPTTRRW